MPAEVMYPPFSVQAGAQSNFLHPVDAGHSGHLLPSLVSPTEPPSMMFGSDMSRPSGGSMMIDIPDNGFQGNYVSPLPHCCRPTLTSKMAPASLLNPMPLSTGSDNILNQSASGVAVSPTFPMDSTLHSGGQLFSVSPLGASIHLWSSASKPS
jgi:hypothetical protein